MVWLSIGLCQLVKGLKTLRKYFLWSKNVNFSVFWNAADNIVTTWSKFSLDTQSILVWKNVLFRNWIIWLKGHGLPLMSVPLVSHLGPFVSPISCLSPLLRCQSLSSKTWHPSLDLLILFHLLYCCNFLKYILNNLNYYTTVCCCKKRMWFHTVDGDHNFFENTARRSSVSQWE